MSKRHWMVGGALAAAVAACALAALLVQDAQQPPLKLEARSSVAVVEQDSELTGDSESDAGLESPDTRHDDSAGARSAAHAATKPTADTPDAVKCDASLIVRVVNRDTDAPAKGVRVSVRPADPAAMTVSVRNVAKATATLGEAPITGDDGRVDVALPSGIAFRARARAELGAKAEVLIEVPVLRAGEHREVVVRLSAETSLRILGQVVAAADLAPIGGAHVKVLQGGTISMREGASSREEPELDVLADAKTDATGRFELELATWNSTYLRVEKRGYAVAFRLIEVLASSKEEIHVIPLSLGATIRGRVLDPSGAPFPDARVCVGAVAADLRRGPGVPVLSFGIPNETWCAKTTQDGRCELSDVAPRESLSVVIRVGAGVIHEEVNAMVLEPGETRDVEWRIGERSRLCGSFVDQDEKPVRAHAVWIMRAEHDGPRRFQPYDESSVFATTSTDERGTFCFDGVPPGKWYVGPAASRNDARRATEDSVVASAQLVEIKENAREQQCTIHVTRGLFVRGRVEGPDGKPAANIQLEARRLGATGIESVTSGPDGTFAIGPLRAESFDVVAKGGGLLASSEPIRATAGDAGLVLELRRAGVISGTVVDSVTGEACAARVAVTGDTESESKAQKTAGESIGFRFDGLAPGIYDLFAHTSDDRVGLLRGVAVDAGREVRDLVLRVDAGAKLELKYSGARKYAIVEIKSGSASIFRGSIRAHKAAPRSVPAGSLEVALMNLDGEVTHVQRVDVAVGETKAVELSDTP